MKGFRPGKEPPRIRKQQAKKELGSTGTVQDRLLELFSERTRAESRKLIRTWQIGFLAAGIVLAVAAVVLAGWSAVAAGVAAVLAVFLLVVWWRLRSQRAALELMIEKVSRP